jgi:hypothetical protein
LLSVSLHPFALGFFYYQVLAVILILRTLPILLSFLAPFAPSGFLSVHQQFFEAIIFGARSIVAAVKPLFLLQRFIFYALILII